MGNKETVRAMFEALSKGDAASFLAPLADDVTFTITGTTSFSGTFKSKQEFIDRVLTRLGDKLEGGLSLKVLDLIAEGDTVVSLAQGAARTMTGKPYNNFYAHVFKFRGGKIREVTEFMDTELVTAALG